MITNKRQQEKENINEFKCDFTNVTHLQKTQHFN